MNCECCGATEPIEGAGYTKFFRAFKREVYFCGRVCLFGWIFGQLQPELRRGI